METAIVGPHILSIWRTTKEKNEENQKYCIGENFIILLTAGNQMGRDGGTKLAPDLSLIPSCHEIETFTHPCIYEKKKKKSNSGKEA